MSEWISVDSGVPIINKMILVYSKNGNILCLFRSYDEWVLQECEYGKDNFFCGESIEFTHWMPLPKPPVVKDENPS